MSLEESRGFIRRIESTIGELRQLLLAGRTGEETLSLPSQTIEAADRIEQVVAMVATCLAAPSVERLASRDDLSRLAAHLDIVAGAFRANPGNLAGATALADSSLEAAIDPLSNILSMLSGPGQLLADVGSARAQVELQRSRLAQASDELKRMESSRVELVSRFETLNQQVQSFLAEQNSGFLALQSSREETLRKSTEDSRARTEESLAKLAETEARRLSIAEASLADFVVRRDAALDELSALREGRLETLGKLHSEAKQIVGAIGETAQAGGYEQVAASAEKRATNWERITVASMFAVVLVAGFSVFFDSTSVLDGLAVLRALGKIVLVVALGLLSRYGATVANRSRREHLWAKQRGLELKALAGYLENFEPEVRVEVRKQLIDKYFGVGSTMLNEVASTDPAPTSSHDVVIDLLRGTVDKLSPQAMGELVSVVVARSAANKK